MWLSFSIYHQIKEQKDLPQAWQTILYSFTVQQWWKFIIVLVLMFLNWGLEAYKWQWLMKRVQRISFKQAYKAIFAGQAFAFGSVNNIAEFIGKIAYLDEGNRLRSIALSVVGSISQVIVTFVMGIAGLIYLRLNISIRNNYWQRLDVVWFYILLLVLMVVFIILLLLYYRLSWISKILERAPFISRYIYLIRNLEELHSKELTRILSLSFARFVVFVIQYLLLLQIFKVDANNFGLIWMVCVMFLVLAIIPTIAFAELGLRGEISIQLIGLLSNNIAGILLATTGIWFINKVLPAIAGSLILLRLRLFKK